jgi:Zn-dependent metalloprotease
MTCSCFIVPQDVLERLAGDPELSDELRRGLADTAALSDQFRAVRQQQAALSLAALRLPVTSKRKPTPKPHALPASNVYDCRNGTTLPGSQLTNPGTSADGAAKRSYAESQAVAQFYWDIFQRDSVDDHNMTLVSSIHYSSSFNNAFWNGSQMVYGDGDGQVFVDFTQGNDVIGHELTHGVTQHSLALNYANEPGGLNESISDVFGSMFRQWQAKQDVSAADWLIGSDIMGPAAKKKGYTCLRDMANPAASHCLAPQPTNFSQYHAGMDPHYSSGIPNLAFCKAAKAYGGKSWEKVGQIWYKALTMAPPTPNMHMKQFANRTRTLSSSVKPADAKLHKSIDDAWTAVGL